MSRIRTLGASGCLATLVLGSTAGGVLAGSGSVVLEPVKDNSIYSDNLSNGSGEHLFVGQTIGFGARRALLTFDVAGNVPAGATITGASLSLTASMSAPGSDDIDTSLHRLTLDWGESTSDAGEPGGFGDDPDPGDASWDNNFFPADFWAGSGGDFEALASATANVQGPGSYVWSSDGMVADVQAWLDDPGSNFGWIAMSPEGGNSNARRYGSRENGTVEDRPALTIEFDTGNGTSVPATSPWGALILTLGMALVAGWILRR